MRKIKELQLSLGEVPIEKIRFNPKSRDDIPAVLIGLQYIYVNTKTREELFSLLEKEFLAEVNFDVGRPGMDIWRVVVLGVLKQGLGCDYDRLHELANNHSSLRGMLGHSDYSGEYEYELQTIMDNVSLLEPEMLNKIGEKVFSVFEEHTRWIAKGKAGVPVELGVPVCVVKDQHQVHTEPQGDVERRGHGCGGGFYRRDH